MVSSNSIVIERCARGSLFLLLALLHSLRALTVAQLHTVAPLPPQDLGPRQRPAARATSLGGAMRGFLLDVLAGSQVQEQLLGSAYLRRRATDATYCFKANAIGTLRKLNLVHAAQRRLSWGVVLTAVAAGIHLYISGSPAKLSGLRGRAQDPVHSVAPARTNNVPAVAPADTGARRAGPAVSLVPARTVPPGVLVRSDGMAARSTKRMPKRGPRVRRPPGQYQPVNPVPGAAPSASRSDRRDSGR